MDGHLRAQSVQLGEVTGWLDSNRTSFMFPGNQGYEKVIS